MRPFNYLGDQYFMKINKPVMLSRIFRPELKKIYTGVLLFLCLHGTLFAHENISNRCYRVVGDIDCLFYSVGMHQLLSIPNSCDGKTIKVRGVDNFYDDGA